ncbi:SDR family NAD(P)-dependent oxidoreductase [Rubritalea tangerina]|uniref:SDR family NAD(P)-dependent oxidoreductase n=1 Tax=Rubritalea tangerina TaxID=430798 RepID=A0ABW4ZEA5_9BACT
MKNYLVVGGNSGIGQALIAQLLEQNHKVHAATRSQTNLPPGLCSIQSFDATIPSELQLPNSLDGLVYCPGTITLKPFHRLTREDFMHDLEINYLGAVHILQAALPSLKKSPSPSVVLFSSVAARHGLPFHSSISAAKAAVEGLTLALAAEWAPSIRVNAIAPSLTNTTLASPLLNSEAKQEAAAKRHPLHKVGNPEDLAAIASFLLSSQAQFITGQIITADGGISSITK